MRFHSPKVCKSQKVSKEHNFFEGGGHSLNASELINLISDKIKSLKNWKRDAESL